MDPPPPSQSQQTPRSTIFTNVDGTPIRVFTQADLLGRGKLLKELRLNGAELSSDATNAQIMLVDPSSRQGRLFIEGWGQDSDRTVLISAWVKRSIAAGHPLLEGDQWGDCLPQEADFQPINGQGDADILDFNLAKSPLPTPRVTPEERSKMQPPTVHSKPSAVDVKSYPNDLPLRQLPPSPIATHTNPTDMAFQPQPQHGMPTMNPFMFMQNNNMQGPMITLAQAMLGNMMMPNFIPNQQIPSDAFRLALQDSLRNQFMGWPGALAQPGLSVENPPISQLQQPPLPYPIVPFISESKEGSLRPSVEQPASRPASASSEFISENSMRKGKVKERVSPPSHKRRKILSSSAKVAKEYDGGPSSKAGTPLQGTSVTSEARTLFTKDAGQPLRFYVQVDIHGRNNLVSMIKKNGGTIVGEAALADYAVLSVGNKSQKVYKSLLSAATSAGIPAIQARFISDCISEDSLLDHAPFLFDSHPKRKRKRSMSTATVESEDDANTEDDGETILPKKKKQGTKMKIAKESEAKKPVPHEIPKVSTTNSESHPKVVGGPRTPTPPLEHTREPWGAIGFRFSQAENDFALRYAKILIDRDYTISQSAVTAAIHEKLPHHSLASWRTHVTYIAREWDTWRKHAAIAHRKAQSQKDAVAANMASALLKVETETPVEDLATLADLPNGNPIDPGELEEDINAAVQFFVEGNDNDETEDESSVWKRLAQQTHCKTAATWEMFYERYALEVIDRFNKALGQGRPT